MQEELIQQINIINQNIKALLANSVTNTVKEDCKEDEPISNHAPIILLISSKVPKIQTIIKAVTKENVILIIFDPLISVSDLIYKISVEAAGGNYSRVGILCPDFHEGNMLSGLVRDAKYSDISCLALFLSKIYSVKNIDLLTFDFMNLSIFSSLQKYISFISGVSLQYAVFPSSPSCDVCSLDNYFHHADAPIALNMLETQLEI